MIKTDTAVFKKQLADYKKLIDEDIATYSKHVQKTTLQQYGANARLEVDTFLSILGRGGKRLRGSLVMVGYEMSGGTNQNMILQAARAIEMLHAYILIIDDIQDRSAIRRGGPSAHTMLADHHRSHHLLGNPEHFGISIAFNAALTGAHAAQAILANLESPQDLKLSVLSITNRTMIVTAHGQTNDIYNEASGNASKEDVENVMLWKTAQYSFLNPLHVGMVLAGADCHATDAITKYAMSLGKAYQIHDDIMGIFGSELENGKSPLDDIREGKQTLLTLFALEHAPKADRNFLIQMLGNQQLTQAEFKRCQDIILESGALSHAQKRSEQHVALALKSLEKEKSRWSKQGIQFLSGLARHLLDRQS